MRGIIKQGGEVRFPLYEDRAFLGEIPMAVIANGLNAGNAMAQYLRPMILTHSETRQPSFTSAANIAGGPVANGATAFYQGLRVHHCA